MTTKKPKKKQKAQIRPEKRLRRIYNRFFLVILSLAVLLSLLPAETQRHLVVKYVWHLPVLIPAILLVAGFFVINREAVSSVISEPCFPAKNSPGRTFLAAGLIVAAAFTLFSYRLGALDFWDDEYLVVKAAQGYHETGTYHSWNFIKDAPEKKLYSRAWPHTWLIAQSYRLFGVSEWSSRIVSVLFGCIFIIGAVFVNWYFTGDIFFSYLVAVVFLFNPDFIYYWRYARMYAILLPLFFIMSACVFRAVDGRPVKKEIPNAVLPRLFTEYLNLDYAFLILSMILIYWAYQIHIISLIIFPAAFAFIALTAVVRREKKYIFLSLLGAATGIAAYLLIPRRIIQDYASMTCFFKAFNPLYLKLSVQHPFFPPLNLALLFGGIFILPLLARSTLQKKLLYCLSMVVTSLVFYVFMVNFYGAHFRYISHIIPFFILIICFVYFVILKVYKNRYVLIIGAALMLAAQSTNFIGMMKYLYYGARGQPYPSVAYATIRDNLKSGQAIFAQSLRDYYMRGIEPKTPIISLGHIKENKIGTNPYRFENFFNDLLTRGEGWVVWPRYKEYHIDPKVAAYVKACFKHWHGQGIDDTGVEVYSFDRSMIRIPNFKLSRPANPSHTGAR